MAQIRNKKYGLFLRSYFMLRPIWDFPVQVFRLPLDA